MNQVRSCSQKQVVQKLIIRRYFCSNNKLGQFFNAFRQNLREEMGLPKEQPKHDAMINPNFQDQEPVNFVDAFKQNFKEEMGKEFNKFNNKGFPGGGINP